MCPARFAALLLLPLVSGCEALLGFGEVAPFPLDDDCPTGSSCPSGFAPRLAVGSFHTCAIGPQETARCWGYGDIGQLGYADTNNVGDDESPASAGDVKVGGPVTQMAAGRVHTCALLAGTVRCWGAGVIGQLGYGNTHDVGDDETPVSAGDVEVGAPVMQIAAGGDHTCALLIDGAVRCWGAGNTGQLGYGNQNDVGDDETPASIGDVQVGAPGIRIAAGGGHTCALLTSGAVRCWGYGVNGRLGYGNNQSIGNNETPAAAGDVELGDAAIQIAAGTAHTCALLATGAVRCWGSGENGRLGYGNTLDIGDDETPTAGGDIDVGQPVVQIATGEAHTCAVLATGAVRCWGSGAHGQLGYGNTLDIGDDESPASIGDVDVGGEVVRIAAGGSHTCARLVGGSVRCWGHGADGRLGYGNTLDIGDDESPAAAGDVPCFASGSQ